MHRIYAVLIGWQAWASKGISIHWGWRTLQMRSLVSGCVLLDAQAMIECENVVTVLAGSADPVLGHILDLTSWSFY